VTVDEHIAAQCAEPLCQLVLSTAPGTTASINGVFVELKDKDAVFQKNCTENVQCKKLMFILLFTRVQSVKTEGA
jgi:hypothetical protein